MLASLMSRLMRCVLVVVALIVMIAPVQAKPLVFHASMSGGQTLDQGEGGGNPFASALIEALGAPVLALSDLPTRLRELTAAKSRGFQSADVPASIGSSYALVPAPSGEKRIALVMVVSDYGATEIQSLPGAEHDANRIARALVQAGFQTELALDLDLRGMRAKLAEFGQHSHQADAAVIYTTGHGVEVDGTVFLLPGDYPVAEHNTALARRALPLPEIARSLRAKQVNLVFYGGCRDNPLAP